MPVIGVKSVPGCLVTIAPSLMGVPVAFLPLPRPHFETGPLVPALDPPPLPPHAVSTRVRPAARAQSTTAGRRRSNATVLVKLAPPLLLSRPDGSPRAPGLRSSGGPSPGVLPAGVPQLFADPVGDVHGGRGAAASCRLVHAGERGGHADGRDHAPGVVVDGGRHRGHAGIALLHVLRVAALAYPGQLPPQQGRVGDGVRGPRRQRAVAQQPRQVRLPEGGQEHLPAGGAVGEVAVAQVDHGVEGAQAFAALNVDHVRAIEHPDLDGRPGPGPELVDVHGHGLVQLEVGGDQGPQLVDLDPQPVTAGARVLLDQVLRGQGGEQPVDGALAQAEPARELAHPQLPVAGGEGAEQSGRGPHRGERPGRHHLHPSPGAVGPARAGSRPGRLPSRRPSRDLACPPCTSRLIDCSRSTVDSPTAPRPASLGAVCPHPRGGSTRDVSPCGTHDLPPARTRPHPGGGRGSRGPTPGPRWGVAAAHRRGPARTGGGMGVLRLSHVEVRVTDLELATAYYVEVLGLVEVGHEEGRTYLKCWDEHDHHSVVLRAHPGPGLEHLSFKVEREDDLDRLERALAGYGCAVRRLAAGEELGQGEAIRVQAPSGHEVELVHAMVRTGNLLPRVNPPPEPDGLPGVHPPRLNHAAITAEEVEPAAAFFTAVLGFRVTERLLATGGGLLGAWLERSHSPNDLAITGGPQGGLHHFGFWVDDWHEVRRAADVLAYNGVHIETGPTRQGITRSLGVHCFDPSGNRHEVFTGGYRPDPDQEPTTWTEDEIGRAYFHYRGRLDSRFLVGYR